jgi:hypothetical protein
MFTKIKKVFKYTVYASAAIIALAVVIDITHESDSERLDRSISNLSSKTEQALATVERARVEEEKRIAEAKAEAERNSPEGKTRSFVSRASGLCRQHVRTMARFPSEVDFNWLDGNNSRYWMNFNSSGKSRVMIRNAGKMMNGLGMMVPFQATCKYDYNPATNKYTIVEVLI